VTRQVPHRICSIGASLREGDFSRTIRFTCRFQATGAADLGRNLYKILRPVP
jgi:hypothetical protein